MFERLSKSMRTALVCTMFKQNLWRFHFHMPKKTVVTVKRSIARVSALLSEPVSASHCQQWQELFVLVPKLCQSVARRAQPLNEVCGVWISFSACWRSQPWAKQWVVSQAQVPGCLTLPIEEIAPGSLLLHNKWLLDFYPSYPQNPSLQPKGTAATCAWTHGTSFGRKVLLSTFGNHIQALFSPFTCPAAGATAFWTLECP